MTENEKCYYTLRYELATSSSQKGKTLIAGTDTIRIGQTEDCQLKFENRSEYADELFAVIKPCEQTASWILIPSSEYIKCYVNGTCINLLHHLRDGDLISFDDYRDELRFSVHYDNKYNSNSGPIIINVSMTTSMKVACVIISMLFIVVFSVLINNNVQKYRVDNVLKELNSSVFRITVDSVYYLQRSIDGNGAMEFDTIGRFSYEIDGAGAICGTAFLVGDSMYVTARHCIEPWLNDTTINHAVYPEDLVEGPVRWAFEAETTNQLADSNLRLVTSVCKILRGEDEHVASTKFRSTDFVIDDTRDDIVDKGGFFRPCYWRNIWRRNAESRMTLGDVAYTLCDNCLEANTTLSLADEQFLTEHLTNGAKVYFLGFPERDETYYEYKEGSVKKNFVAGEQLHHGVELSHGFSGGPVVVINSGFLGRNTSATVVSVISVADTKSDDRSYSVPITELKLKR